MMLLLHTKRQIIALTNRILANLVLQEFKAPKVRGRSYEENLVLA